MATKFCKWIPCLASLSLFVTFWLLLLSFAKPLFLVSVICFSILTYSLVLYPPMLVSNIFIENQPNKINPENVEMVKNFVRELQYPVRQLSTDTTLFGNLGIDGWGGYVFMEDFFERFGVDPGNFQLDKHFGPEGFSPTCIYWILRDIFIRGVSQEARRGLIPISIGDLAQVVEAKKWIMY